MLVLDCLRDGAPGLRDPHQALRSLNHIPIGTQELDDGIETLSSRGVIPVRELAKYVVSTYRKVGLAKDRPDVLNRLECRVCTWRREFN